MQIKKVYREINPELLYNEVRDFTLKQGAVLGSTKMETYSLPSDSSSHISSGTLMFTVMSDGKQKECLRAHIVGSAKSETKLMIDIEESLFSKEKAEALQTDLDFIFSSYEAK